MQQLLGWSSGTSQGPYSVPKRTPSPGRYAKCSPGSFALETLIGKAAHPEQMENRIQLYLWLQASACLDKSKAAISGQESGGSLQHPLEGRVPPGWSHAWSK